ncbi:MAG: alginate lyase family protein, partial [Planctomycetaceae bacterium]|nr:alginate lyase family protein [Planctomycetaceae bacterium]
MSPPRWWYVARYHHPSQLVWRGVSMVRRRLFRLLPHARYTDVDGRAIARRSNSGFRDVVARHLKLRDRPCGERAARAIGLQEDAFVFLNERRTLPLPVDWSLQSVPAVSHLWRFHLHYHEFLLDLLGESLAEEQTELRTRIWDIVADWMQANPIERPGALADAWHPFCLSKRIAVWLMLWHAIEPPENLRDRFAASLESQVRFLERHLEWDLRGNHLLENLRTLVLAGAFFDGPAARRRLDHAVPLLRRQLKEQILPSGEHFERSPMYHAQMLSAVLDVRDALAGVQLELSGEFTDIAARMKDFLLFIIHTDGEVALLADTALGETPDARVLCEAAATRDLSQNHHLLQQASVIDQFPDALAEIDHSADEPEGRSHSTARAAVRSRADKLPAAAGSTGSLGTSGVSLLMPVESGSPVAAQFNQNHDCPAMSETRGDYWKWRDAGDCLLFDAGPVGADELPAHAHCDLLTIEASLSGRRLIVDSGVYDYADGEMRQYCRSTAAHNVLQIDGEEQCDTWSRFRMGYRGHPSALVSGETDGFHWCRAHHNAYRRLEVPVVGRWLACRSKGPWFCVDWAAGRGRHDLITRLHLSPEVSLTQVDAHSVAVELATHSIRIRSLTDAEITIGEAWYCPDFGVRRAA